MMEDYARISLETHLFFARIMKEHSFFLEAGFLKKDAAWARRAEFFRRQFEELLRQTVRLSNRMISGCVLESGELVTPFTFAAERGTTRLTGIPLDTSITRMQRELRCGRMRNVNRETMRMIQQLNQRALWLLNGLIQFKENTLREVRRCRLFTANYPLLIEHILREARLYRETVNELQQGKDMNFRNLQKTEAFWSRDYDGTRDVYPGTFESGRGGTD